MTRFFRWLSDFLWPGESAKNAAKVDFTAYMKSKDLARLKDAMANFETAVEQFRKHQNSSLSITLHNYAIAVRRHYEDAGRSLDDLNKVIRLDIEARESWSSNKDADTYFVILKALAGAYFEQYQRAFEASLVKADERQHAFEQAVTYFTELKDIRTSGNQRSAAQIQLGTVFRTRCGLEHTLDHFEIGVQHLQDALLETAEAGKEIEAGDEGDNAKPTKKAALDDITATCLLNLAESYELRYNLSKDPQDLYDLTMAIDFNTRAIPLLEALDRSDLSASMFNLARQLWLRYWQTRDQTDYDTAHQMAISAKNSQALDDALQRQIDHFLRVIHPDDSMEKQIATLMAPLQSNYQGV